MCDCPKDKNNEFVSSRKDDVTATSPQKENGEPVERRQKQGCCRRVLTYEDEVTVTELPISIPQTPRKSPGIPRCDLTGVAIVRRRIDFGTSPDQADEASKKADQSTANEDKQQPKDLEKEGEITTDVPQNADKNDQQQTDNVVTSTPCPGQLNPNNDCNCSTIPKTGQ